MHAGGHLSAPPPLKPGCREAGRPRLKTQQTRPSRPKRRKLPGHSPPTKFTAKTKMPRAAVHARGAESNRKEERTFPMKPQYFDSQKAAAIISEPNDDRRSLMVDALTGDEAKLLCKLLLEFVPRKGAQKVRIRTIH